MDYIALWFIKGARYIANTRAELTFVSVNSICQGEHVGIMFPKIFDENVEIGFAHTSFKWKNSARDNAGVTVIIMSLRNIFSRTKYLYADALKKEAKNISPYLTDSPSIIVHKATKPLNGLPEMLFGSMPNDNGFLVVTEEEKSNFPELHPYLKDFYGADEFINGKKRYCLLIKDEDVEAAIKISEIARRIEGVRKARRSSKRPATKRLAQMPHRFGEMRYKPTKAILVPEVSSENRIYVPMGYVGEDVVISNKAFAIYDAELWIFGLLESKMHMTWIRAVCGQLETRTSYSSTLGYNTFPVNPLSQDHKDALNKTARRILLARAAHPEKTLANMYDPDKMPTDLREAHNENDHLINNLYKRGGFKNDEELIATLFELYEKMTAKEKAK